MHLLITLALSTVTALGSVLIHALATHMLIAGMRRAESGGRQAVYLLVATVCLLIAHVVEVIVYAVAYIVLIGTGSGALIGAETTAFDELLYFSFVVYTSLGFGDIIPQAGARLMAGSEALVGLILIAWTAAVLFSEIFLHALASRDSRD